MTQTGHRRSPPAEPYAYELRGSGPDGAIDLATAMPLLGPRTARPPRSILRDRWLFMLVFALALAIFAATDPGRIFFDTKLGVDIDPSEFLVRLWSLWNPLEWFGTLQDQYIGYAFPMAPFFLAGQLLHVPVWLTERLWLALLIAVGFTGMVRLARALRIGTEGSRLLAGAVFALWPTFTIVIGSTSAAALPGLMVPWAVLPLISAAQGRLPPGRAAARSGLAVTAMAGVNAVSTLAVLILPALYIVTHTRARQRLRLGVFWCGAVLAGTLWWVIPLVLQSRYSFNFLPYIEQAATTARTTSAATTLRGAGTWTAYFNLGGTPWLQAGWVTVTSPLAILASAVAAAAGLAGLARRDMPGRRWLCCCVGLVAAVTLAAYYGPAGGPWHAVVDNLFDGPLAPFRSTYKLEPVVAVVLALGFAHALERCWRHTIPAGASARLTARAVTAPALALVLVGLALPQLSGKVLQAGSFRSVPHYWYQVADFLAAHSARNTALVVPANAHGQFTWGDTIDNPLEPLATSPWAERGLVPYGGAGSQILLQTAEQALESGQQVPGLAAYLTRAGIRYVVVRNDTSPSIAGYTAPQTVNETLAQSGFRRVAAFGPWVAAAPGYPSLPGLTPGFSTRYPAVEVFAPTDASLRPASPVAMLPLSKTVMVDGGPDSLLQLAGQGLPTSQPAVIAGDSTPARPALIAVTDGQRRADEDFGTTANFQSFTYTATERNPAQDPLGDPGGAPRQLLPVSAAGHQTVAVLVGAASVTASSAGTWLGESTQYDPVNAFDGNPATAWTESNPSTPVGQWIQVNFRHSVTLPATARIQLLDDSYARSIANQVRVTTAAGSATTQLEGSGSVQPLRLPPGPSPWLRITITGASNVIAGNPGAGISDVLIPGVRVTGYLQPAQPTTTTAPVSYSFGQTAASPVSQPGAGQLNRTFVLSRTTQLTAKLEVVPQPGTALDSLLGKLSRASRGDFTVRASSTWDDLPELGPHNLFSDATDVPWLAGAADPDPTLRLTWHGNRTISKLILEPAGGLAAAPTSVTITTHAGSQQEAVRAGGVVRISPSVRTSALTLSFPDASSVVAGYSASGQPTQLPLGLSKIVIPALSRLRVAAPSSSARFRLSCGDGPTVTVDGNRYHTSVTGTIGDLMQLRPLTAQLCTPGSAITLPAGRQWLTTSRPRDFAVTSLTLNSPAAAAALGQARSGAAQTRAARVDSWGADSRLVQVGSGPASYLEIHENANPGWTATLHGRKLTAVTLDGWQQAFVVPAGSGGAVHLTFTPTVSYHAGLLVSVIALLMLIIAALGLGSVRRGSRNPNRPAGTNRRQASPARLATARPAQPALVFRKATVSNLAGYQPDPAAMPREVNGQPLRQTNGELTRTARRPSAGGRSGSASRAGGAVLALAPVTAVIVVAGGLAAIAVPALAVLDRFRPHWRPWIAAAGMTAAGVVAASAATPTALGSGPFSGAAQVCALVALAAALLPTAYARSGRRRRLSRQPFSTVDEACCYFDRPAEPANIHLEMRVPGRLDRRAFTSAATQALAAHERASRRRAASRPWHWRFFWEQPTRFDHVPVDFVSCPDEADLAGQRAAFLARSPDIRRAPAATFLVASGPGGDCIILNAHHAVMDGLSWLSLLRDLAARYRAAVPALIAAPADPAPHNLVRSTQDPAAQAAPAGVTAAPDTARTVARALWRPRPARIAADGGGGQGCGVLLLPFPAVPTPVQAEGGSTRATVNDALITALVVAIGRWNTEHDRAVRPVRITVPFNAREAGEQQAAGNRSRVVTVTVAPSGPARHPVAVLQDVARLIRHARLTDGPQLDSGSRRAVAIWCPTVAKRWLVRAALRTVGPLVCDSAMLTNLGNVPEPPDFGMAGTTTMGLSGPAHMPRGLSVAAITSNGRLTLGMRYNRRLLSVGAARRFADRYLAALGEITVSPGDPSEGEGHGTGARTAQDSRLPG